jgi:hypothetical protein
MTISSSHLHPELAKPSTPEINLVATTQLSPERFIISNQLDFISSSDDVGSLVFSAFSLPSGHSISLVHYLDAPYPGVQVYINPNSSSPSQILSEAIDFLHLSPNDLDWIHPQIRLTNQ